MKRLVSFVLVMVMVLSIFTIVPFSASAADTKTVYFQNNWMWTDVKVYYWGSSSTNSAGWPGDTPQLVGNDGVYDVYAATVPTDVAGVIFNGFDGGTGSLNQTPDITDAANGDCYYMVWNNKNEVGKDSISNILPNIVTPTTGPTPIPTTGPTPSGSKTVYFQNNWMWTDVHAYFWGSSSTNSAEWPGDTPVLAGNDGTYDIYSVTVPSDVAGVIFNGIDGGTGGLNQTPDITDSADGDCYYMVWSDAEQKNTVGKEDINLVLPNPDKPTDAPETQAPVTQAPVTQAPATQAPVTQAPATQAPVTEAPEVDGLFVKVGDKLYEVNKGDTFTYNYYLSVDSSLKISSLDINMTYDTKGLDLVPFADEYGDVDLTKHFPKIYGGVVHNFKIDGEIYYNYSNVAGVRLANDSLVFTAQFKVTADKGIYEISEKIVTMADSDMNKIVYDEIVIQDVFTDKVDVADADVYVPTVAPDTQAPVTQAPVTQAPATTPVDDNGLYVVADGVKYAVTKGEVFTYNYYLSVDSSLKISSLDINMFYDTEGLDFAPFADEYGDVDLVKHFPKISGGVVNNFGIDGEIYYNYSNVAGVRLANNSLVFTGQFKVTADKGTYNINSKMITMADSDMNKIVYDQEVIQPDVFTIKTEIADKAPYVPTEAPETQAPVTQAPKTEAPATQAPATQAPATQVPATTPVVDDGLFIEMDGDLYKVEKGQVVTYQYILNVPNGTKISSIDMNTFYDTKGLDFIPYVDEYGDADMIKHFPKISGGCVHNFNIDGEIYYNYSNVAGIRLTNDAVMFEGQFKVTADKGTYKIYTDLVTLADSNMNKIVYDYQVVTPGMHEEKELLVDLSPYVPTEAPKTEAPATEAPATQAPVTQAPVTQAPETQAPVTQAPVTQAPETQAPATEAPATVFVRTDDGTVYPVVKGEKYRYTFYMTAPNKTGSFEASTWYDTDGLKVCPIVDANGDYDVNAMFPEFGAATVYNLTGQAANGEILYNYTSSKGVKVDEDAVFVIDFEVTADEGTYDIFTQVKTVADTYLQQYWQYSEEQKEGVSFRSTLKKASSTDPDGLFVRIGETLYEVEQGKEYTFAYYLQVEDKRIGSIDARIVYDSKGLDFVPTIDEYGDYDMNAMMPKLTAPVMNDTIDGIILFNYTSASGVKFPNQDSVLFTSKFKVTASYGVYEINPYIYCLADEKIGIIVDEGTVLGDYYDKGVLTDAVEFDPNAPDIEEEDLLIGDVNRDGKINVFDVTQIQLYAASFITLDDEQMIIADTNFDGKVNIFDASAIQRYVAGQILGFVKA